MSVLSWQEGGPYQDALFSLRSQAFQRICKTANSVGVTARQRRLLSSAASDSVLQLFILRLRCDRPWVLQRLSKIVLFTERAI